MGTLGVEYDRIYRDYNLEAEHNWNGAKLSRNVGRGTSCYMLRCSKMAKKGRKWHKRNGKRKAHFLVRQDVG